MRFPEFTLLIISFCCVAIFAEDRHSDLHLRVLNAREISASETFDSFPFLRDSTAEVDRRKEHEGVALRIAVSWSSEEARQCRESDDCSFEVRVEVCDHVSIPAYFLWIDDDWVLPVVTLVSVFSLFSFPFSALFFFLLYFLYRLLLVCATSMRMFCCLYLHTGLQSSDGRYTSDRFATQRTSAVVTVSAREPFLKICWGEQVAEASEETPRNFFLRSLVFFFVIVRFDRKLYVVPLLIKSFFCTEAFPEWKRIVRDYRCFQTRETAFDEETKQESDEER